MTKKEQLLKERSNYHKQLKEQIQKSMTAEGDNGCYEKMRELTCKIFAIDDEINNLPKVRLFQKIKKRFGL